jgi:hypothetical protein
LIGSIRQVAHPAKIGVQDRVEQGGLSSATAYEVSKLEDPAAQAELAGAMVEQKLTRSEVAAAVQAVKSRRAVPAAKPGSATFDLGECVVTIRWKKPGPSAAQALRKALK